jgi:hypothetical protein
LLGLEGFQTAGLVLDVKLETAFLDTLHVALLLFVFDFFEELILFFDLVCH